MFCVLLIKNFNFKQFFYLNFRSSNLNNEKTVLPTEKIINFFDSKQNLTNDNVNLSTNLIRYRDKVSVIPEMSDISESSSNSCEKLNKQKRAKRQRTSEVKKFILYLINYNK